LQDRKALEHPAELSFLFLSRGGEDIRGRKARRTGKLRNILLTLFLQKEKGRRGRKARRERVREQRKKREKRKNKEKRDPHSQQCPSDLDP
jgi:hypothetical protein